MQRFLSFSANNKGRNQYKNAIIPLESRTHIRFHNKLPACYYHHDYNSSRAKVYAVWKLAVNSIY